VRTAPLDQYDAVAEAAASVVIRRYSTSFGVASRLLAPSPRRHIQNIYAVVRVADEIVDGVSSAAGLAESEIRTRLDGYEEEVERALATGFGTELTRPFFSSMRADITRFEHTPESFAEYVYGSAEVVGLMCLAAFLEEDPRPDRERLVLGARALGAAFQKVNFLRDLGTDFRSLGRSYFPGVAPDSFGEATKTRLLDDLDADLATAASIVPHLPRGSRAAVGVAHDLFAELSKRLRATPAERLLTTRVSVPNPVKARIVAARLTQRGRETR
jgi:phytoene synthase